MSTRTSAVRYARALLDVSLKESDPQKVEQDLAAFVATVNGHAGLKRAVMSPGIPAATRGNVIHGVVSAMGIQPPVSKLLALLADRGRLELLPDLLDAYRERLLAHRGIVKGTLTAATPLAADKIAAIEESLSHATGKKVQLETAIDSSLIGGVVATIGSTVYDGSIRTQLQRVKRELIDKA